MTDAATPKQVEVVNVTIDGKATQVPKGTNIIEAAKGIGIDIPHYCYHPHLSIAGNCRMCQISVKGMPKMTIACNTGATEGMEVSTHHTSKDVADAQAATLEFILINHPLDCTVCDQAGHCKLQDYHFEYNARPSRFVEQKVHKIKALPLGPTVMLDGERCIMCTRCIRFCDEITKTSELGMLNRGDQSVIAVSPGKELNNPLSGSVVDLCPVGALTHRQWRFNTRIWFTNQTESICPGCSTGCNVKVAERDGKIVNVKARRNDAVNKEWLCDEGRYGFERFLPASRITGAYRNVSGGGREDVQIADVINALKGTLKTLTVLLSPDLLVEEYYLLRQLLNRATSVGRAVMTSYKRSITPLEEILVSPDYASNLAGARISGLVGEESDSDYREVLQKIRRKEIENILVLGDRAIAPQDIDEALLEGLATARVSVGVLTDADSKIASSLGMVLGGRSVLEKSGLLVNGKRRLQYAQAVVQFPDTTMPEWRLLGLVGEAAGYKMLPVNLMHVGDRELTRWYLGSDPVMSSQGITIAKVKGGGVQLSTAAKDPSVGAQSGLSMGASSAA
ncbi:MAG: NADH-quinone oxidoreductase chain 3 [Pseudomonadota bacterium]|jgi:NADH-quinone oxidoreductase subunit G